MGDSAVLRVVAFAALAAFAAAGWVAMLDDPPLGRVAAAVAIAVLGGAVIAAIAAPRVPRLAAWPLAMIAALVAFAAGAIAVGLAPRLLAPANWGELADGLNGGLSELGSADPPYSGDWSKLAILLGLPFLLVLAAALAFWPARRGAGARRMLSLVILVTLYATGTTLNPPVAPLLGGLALLLLAAAWLWLPRLGRRDALVAAAIVAGAGLLAVPVARGLDGNRPWLDYHDWVWAWYEIGGGTSFDWDHSYGPMDWPRTGRALLEVRSEAPHYWRTAVLDEFDGFRWLESGESPSADVELPTAAGPTPSPQVADLERDWIDEIKFTVRGLRSDLLVGTGAVLSVDGPDVTTVPGGVGLAGESLTEGDSYTVRAYTPDPTADQMLAAPDDYPQAIAPYTAVTVPRTRVIDQGEEASSTVLIAREPLAVPLWGSPQPGRRAARTLSASPYGAVYRLAHRLTADAPTTYEAVKAIHDHLQESYSYSETPPERAYPLRAFLFRDRIGYCQQFSGTMTLMLRMVGIPSRVATGFSPGTRSRDGDDTYRVSDLDAHSWVEVYFSGIGWVAFDPTPTDAPAQSQSNGLGLFADAPRGQGLPPGKEGRAIHGGGRDLPATAARSSGGFSPWLVPLFALALVVAGAAAAIAVRARRSRALEPAAAIDARLRELEAALQRLRRFPLGGVTLLGLERRLTRRAGPAAAAYAARLRAARYSLRNPGPPTPAERRALRRELSSGLGLRARLRAYLAIPPGGPAAR